MRNHIHYYFLIAGFCLSQIFILGSINHEYRELVLRIEHERQELESKAQMEAAEAEAAAAEAERRAYYDEKRLPDEKERKLDNLGAAITLINYDEYLELIASDKSFLLEVGRVTCPYCVSLSYLIKDMDTHGESLYVLDLEDIRGTDRYDEIKAGFGINYVPTLFYIEEGSIKCCLNSPLKDNLSQITSADERNEIKKQVNEDVEQFLLGAIGMGELINEVPIEKSAD